MVLIVEKPQDLLHLVGTRVGPSGWIAVEQDRVNQFAECTGDHQWIHVDVDRARAGPFGGTIAHGFLTMSMIGMFVPDLIEVRGFAHAVNVGLDRLRFLAPVVVGRRIRAVCEVLSAETIKGGIQAVMRVTIEVEGSEKPALIADTISRFYPE